MTLILEGLREAWQLLLQRDPDVWGPAARSLCISAAATCLAGILGVPLALLLARRRFPGRSLVLLLCRAGMALPTVFLGVLCFAMFSRRGPLGPWELLYSPAGILLGELLLALPLVATLACNAISSLDPRVGETAFTLGAGPWRRARTYLSEARAGVTLALLTAFSRCVTELGIAMMVGGNIRGRTRTLTTAAALETSKGELGRGFALGLLLLAVALTVFLAATCFNAFDERGRR